MHRSQSRHPFALKRARVSQRILTKELEDEEEDSSDILCIRNSVWFYADVNNRNVLKLLQKLNEANEYVAKTMSPVDEHRRVYLYINSPGGEVFSGFSAMDHIWWNPVPVVTVVDGFVASAGTFLLLGGTERKAMRNSRILIHQLSAAFWGKYNDLLDEVKNSGELMKSVKDLYTEQTNMSRARVEEILQKELHMNATQALHYGFVDEVW